MSWNSFGWRPYVPVAQRRANAARALGKLTKKSGVSASPVRLEARTIASTFWGRAWCDNLEAYSDFANRLPRGRTYVRNGSVVDLQIERGKVTARVAGSELYTIGIKIKPLAAKLWQSIQTECAGKIDSLIELLQGRLSSAVMEIVTRRERGLFPTPREIDLDCSCPDWADLCKHVAASLYGVGARFDQQPELLFLLRGVDPADLISRASATEAMRQSTSPDGAAALSETELEDVFGIELAPPAASAQIDAAVPASGGATTPVADSAPKAKTKSKPRKNTTRKLSVAAKNRMAATVRARWTKAKTQKPRAQKKTVVAAKARRATAAKAKRATKRTAANQ